MGRTNKEMTISEAISLGLRTGDGASAYIGQLRVAERNAASLGRL